MKKAHLLLLFFLGIMTFTMSSCSVDEDDEIFTETKATGNEADDPAFPDDDD